MVALSVFKKECLDLLENGQTIFDTVRKEQVMYGDRYKPHLQNGYYVCPSCISKLEEIHISDANILFRCKGCEYQYAEVDERIKRALRCGDKVETTQEHDKSTNSHHAGIITDIDPRDYNFVDIITKEDKGMNIHVKYLQKVK